MAGPVGIGGLVRAEDWASRVGMRELSRDSFFASVSQNAAFRLIRYF